MLTRETDYREQLLNAPHVLPLMIVVRRLREKGYSVPNVDPNDGGVKARALFLLESPGPKAVASQFVSRENPDPSACNMASSLTKAGFTRAQTLLWNVVPYCVSTVEKNRNATASQIREAAPYTQSFIDCLRDLKVVIFCGRRAQLAEKYLQFPTIVHRLQTFHTGAMAFNHARCRESIEATFGAAKEAISN